MATRIWKCDSCGGTGKEKPWKCPVCKKETCEYCFGVFGVYEDCCKDRTEGELQILTDGRK